MDHLSDSLRRCLDDLEQRIDEQDETRLLEEWAAFAGGRYRGGIFSPRRSRPLPARTGWPSVSINAALEDYDLMALQQYGACSELLAGAGGLLMAVRCNYGSSIAPLLFGVEPYVMEESLNTLPTSRPLNDIGAVRRLVAAGVPDLRTGYGARVLEMGERYAAISRAYPRIGRHVWVHHPDLQGPMDICEVVWGSSLFYATRDAPGLLHDLLALVTETYIAFMRAWERIIPPRPAGNVHWGFYHRGTIMLRDDSAMNFSPAMFDEFICPYDQRLLEEFGGGAVHFCGKGDHYLPAMAQMRGLYAINLSQPELNDMERIYRHTVDKGIPLLGLKREAAEAALANGRDLHGLVHCS